MEDIQTLTQELNDELLEYLEDAPIKLDDVIYRDVLWDKCYTEVLSRLSADAEAKDDEEREHAAGFNNETT